MARTNLYASGAVEASIYTRAVHPLKTLRHLLAARPLDWSRGAGRDLTPAPTRVDIIIPIYGAAAELAACLSSVASMTDLSRHGVFLIIDGPQQTDVDRTVESFVSKWPEVTVVIRNETRCGFAASVNSGMARSTRDVVLLNSDTVVTHGWIEKLIAAAASHGDVGTATPLSNNATICSIPRPFEENLIPSGHDIDSFAALVDRVSARSYPRVPSGVGFCLYIRRALLDDIGLFDAKLFAAGYGEENDFCFRALERRWLHVVDDATFVYHAGHRSFGTSRRRHQRQSASRLERRHRRYLATIAELMRQDPLGPIRGRIVAALEPTASASTSRRRIVHLVHGWPPFQQAGTELYAAWLARHQSASHDVAVYTRTADVARADGEAAEWMDDGVRVRLLTNNFTARDPLRRNAIHDGRMERDFERFLIEQRPDLLHIHHLAGHSFGMAGVARRLGVPIVLQIQDWWLLCARVNQFDASGRRCSGPVAAKCAACATLTKVAPARITNPLLHALRRRAAARVLASADAFIAGSSAIRTDFASVLPPETPFHVIPYGVATVRTDRARSTASRPIRFGYVGSIAPHKGVHVAVEAMRGVDRSDAALHVWGDDDAYPEYVRGMTHGENVIFEGRFREDEKPRVYASMDVLLVPSIGLESFGLAPREAMMSRVPVIATSGGALDELFAGRDCGELVPPGDVTALKAAIDRLIETPSVIDRWVEQLPRPKSHDTHAEEVFRVYEQVLAVRAR